MKRISAYPLREEHSPNVELDNFIDGISFIEHLSFKAFNEGIRLKDWNTMPTFAL